MRGSRRAKFRFPAFRFLALGLGAVWVADYDGTIYEVTVLKGKLDLALALMADVVLRRRQPVAYGCFGSSQSVRNMPLSPGLLLQVPRAHPPPLPPIQRSFSIRRHALL